MSTPKTCGECLHLVQNPLDPLNIRSKVCNERPPLPVAAQTPQGVQVMAINPPRGADQQACGAFSLKPLPTLAEARKGVAHG